jgi:hypothetical protein
MVFRIADPFAGGLALSLDAAAPVSTCRPLPKLPPNIVKKPPRSHPNTSHLARESSVVGGGNAKALTCPLRKHAAVAPKSSITSATKP